MKKLVKVYEWLIYLLPAILFCSYYPLISLGSSANMNFELSLPLIWLVIFDIFSFVLFLTTLKFKKQYPGITDRRFFFISLFPFFATVSIFWSPNPVRGILTAGILWAIFFAAFFIVYLTKNLPNIKITRAKILKAIFIPAIIISVWCWSQSILDLAGVSSEQTLMCSGCVYQAFGFPHPNGLAIEPQFMGNLLLAPTILALYCFLQNYKSKKYLCLSLFLATTLFIIFSRGAIYSFIIASTLLIVYYIIKQKTAKPLLAALAIAVAFLFALNAQGIMAVLSPTSDTYYTGISKSINQLSLGKITLPELSKPETPVAEPAVEESRFSGYVQESTDVRVSLSSAAIDIWSSNPKKTLFGVGLGGSGEVLKRSGATDLSKEIIQNEFLAILLETGLIGIAILLISVITVMKLVIKTSDRILIIVLAVAYVVSLMFFSGLPNAVHIYLMPALIAYNSTRKKFVS
jgi:hypothetical protein